MTQEQFFARYKYDSDSDLIGGGGFGSVYKAYDNVLNRYVAIKVSGVKNDMDHLSLKKEVELAAKLEPHKNVAHYENCYRFKMSNGTFDYGVLMYYPDGNMSQLITKSKISFSEKEKIAEGIMSGLEFLHNNSVVHRDLKSSNILIAKGLSNEYIPKIADFGLSKAIEDHNISFFENSFIGGSLFYMAPEQFSADSTIRKNVDIWSLGVILFELFTGNVPFRSNRKDASENSRQEIIRQLTAAELPPEIDKIPQPWQDRIRQCLITDPLKRIKTIGELRGDTLIDQKPVIIYATTESDMNESFHNFLKPESLALIRQGKCPFNPREKIDGNYFFLGGREGIVSKNIFLFLFTRKKYRKQCAYIPISDKIFRKFSILDNLTTTLVLSVPFVLLPFVFLTIFEIINIDKFDIPIIVISMVLVSFTAFLTGFFDRKNESIIFFNKKFENSDSELVKTYHKTRLLELIKENKVVEIKL